ncbi:hypothetical protein HFO55_26060 [Rhizobium leguminosarum]|uniref:hypothetical protein n=1 Tax=Rhizobium leguminosarum TaxID=384 RepID=UPI001C9840BB|nr:hypothetical protein [Rhizobium leguminosarum]MBY5570671.1 hypothetical protein [Rhizobium leguminosarum]MBY5577236.1 hypothetical protein [Rhizobium leguminosarum]
MSVPPIDTVQLAMILGSLALASWIAAGLIALIGPAEEIKHIEIGWTSQLLTTAFTSAGITFAVAMIAVMVFGSS